MNEDPSLDEDKESDKRRASPRWFWALLGITVPSAIMLGIWLYSVVNVDRYRDQALNLQDTVVPLSTALSSSRSTVSAFETDQASSETRDPERVEVAGTVAVDPTAPIEETVVIEMTSDQSVEPSATETQAAGVLYREDFDDGDAQGWVAFGSGAKVVDGQYVLIGDSLIVAMAGSDSWRNYSVRIRAKVVSGDDFGVGVAANENCSFYLVQFIRREANLIRFDGSGCPSNYAATGLRTNTYNIEMDTWYDLRIDFFGTTITGYVNGAPVISAEDAVYQKGKIILRAFRTQVFFDEVEVVSISSP